MCSACLPRAPGIPTPAHPASSGKRGWRGVWLELAGTGGVIREGWGSGWAIPVPGGSGQWDPRIGQVWGEWSPHTSGEIPGETCVREVIPTLGWGLGGCTCVPYVWETWVGESLRAGGLGG